MDVYLWFDMNFDGSLCVRAECYTPGDKFEDGPNFGTNRPGLLQVLMAMIEFGLLTTFNGITFYIAKHTGAPTLGRWGCVKVMSDISAQDLVKLLMDAYSGNGSVLNEQLARSALSIAGEWLRDGCQNSDVDDQSGCALRQS